MISKDQLVSAYGVILEFLKQNTTNEALLQNFEGTDLRAAKALMDTCLSDNEISSKLTEILGVSFPVEHEQASSNGMITQGPITIHSCCPHHLYPVRYNAYVSYVPTKNKVLGLSKLARLCKVLGRRPVLHEQLASDIADTLFESEGRSFPSIKSKGSAVMLVGMHTCMTCRGVEEDALTSVVELRGSFWDSSMEEKFYQAVNSIKTSTL